jgi:5-methylcytosine-specific restriction endonuclease McrA
MHIMAYLNLSHWHGTIKECVFQALLVESTMVSDGVLDSSVLVLNRFFAAVQIVTVRKAFSMLCSERAEVVHVSDEGFESYDFESWVELSQFRDRFGSDDGEWVQTISVNIRVPRVIRVLVFDKLPQGDVRFNRRNIFARDDNRCQYCGKKFPTSELSIDHVAPLSRGGKTTWTNVVCACTDCNKRKGGRYPEEAGMHLIKAPKKPNRSPVLRMKLRSPRYSSWRHFVNEAYWTVSLK